jgi:hypothetical protein
MGELLDISRTIQLAFAPVFLLMAIATTLNVLTTRLGRVVDRARTVEGELAYAELAHRGAKFIELRQLETRAKLISGALTAGVAAALVVCLMIGVAFVGFLMQAHAAAIVAVLFVLAVGVFMLALVCFLREVFIAIAMLRFTMPPEVKGTK